MFEKEAEEEIMKKYPSSVTGYKNLVKEWKEGAVFGYNKAFVEADKNLKAVVADFNKANEWHYPSKGEYPKDEKKVLCILGDFENDNLEVGYYSQVEGDSKRWRFEDYDLPDDSEEGWGVSAWKEIVLPELKESE